MYLTVTGITEENGIKNVSFFTDNPKAELWIESDPLKRWSQIQNNCAPVGSQVVTSVDGKCFIAEITDDLGVGDTVTFMSGGDAT